MILTEIQVGYMEYLRGNSAFSISSYLLPFHSLQAPFFTTTSCASESWSKPSWYVVHPLLRARSCTPTSDCCNISCLRTIYPNALSYCDICSQLKLVNRPPLTPYDRLERARMGTRLRVIMTLYIIQLVTL